MILSTRAHGTPDLAQWFRETNEPEQLRFSSAVEVQSWHQCLKMTCTVNKQIRAHETASSASRSSPRRFEKTPGGATREKSFLSSKEANPSWPDCKEGKPLLSETIRKGLSLRHRTKELLADFQDHRLKTWLFEGGHI